MVFTSGSIHYENNSRYHLNKIINGIQSYVDERGLLALEYIHISDGNNASPRHFVTGKGLAHFFQATDWKVTSNKRKMYTEGPNPRNNRVHNIIWGRLYAEKKPK